MCSLRQYQQEGGCFTQIARLKGPCFEQMRLFDVMMLFFTKTRCLHSSVYAGCKRIYKVDKTASWLFHNTRLRLRKKKVIKQNSKLVVLDELGGEVSSVYHT